MIIIAGTASIDPKAHSAAVAALNKMAAASNGDIGNISYRFAISLDDPEGLDIFECWEDQASLDSHRAQSHTIEFIGAIPSFIGATDLKLQRYEVSSAEPYPSPEPSMG